MCIHCFGKNEKYNQRATKERGFTSLTPLPRSQASGCISPADPWPPLPHLFLISLNRAVSLSYPNSPPAGRGTFMMSACVATRTTRSGFFSLPPKAGGGEHRFSGGPPFLAASPPRCGGVSWPHSPLSLQEDVPPA